jgi:hypothetical protein
MMINEGTPLVNTISVLAPTDLEGGFVLETMMGSHAVHVRVVSLVDAMRLFSSPRFFFGMHFFLSGGPDEFDDFKNLTHQSPMSLVYDAILFYYSQKEASRRAKSFKGRWYRALIVVAVAFLAAITITEPTTAVGGTGFGIVAVTVFSIPICGWAFVFPFVFWVKWPAVCRTCGPRGPAPFSQPTYPPFACSLR